MILSPIVPLLFFFFFGKSELKISKLGTTDPESDLILPVNSEIKINCRLTDEGLRYANSSILKWKRTSTEVNMNYVIVLDDQTSQLRIPNATVNDSGFYTCLTNTDDEYAICNKEVQIKYPPTYGVNISCFSLNWQNLTCAWNVPSSNHAKTKWTFLISNFTCPRYTNNNLGCVWDIHSTPYYDQKDNKMLHVLLKGENEFGRDEKILEFNHYDVVLPDPPSEISAWALNSRTLHVKWSPPKKMEYFPPKLYYRLKYSSKWNENWIDIGLGITSINLRHLIPNTNYHIQLMARSGSSNKAPWSNEVSITKNTPADVPGGTVNITFNCFEQTIIGNNREITLYWQTLPEILRNGNILFYNIYYKVDVLENGLERNYSFLKNQKSNTAIISNLKLNESYIFHIKAANDMGESKSFSAINIGRASDVPSPPFHVEVVSFSNEIYEVSWKWNQNNIAKDFNFTVHWCEDHNDPAGKHCYNSSISWLFVANTENRINLTLTSRKYRFAVAVGVGKYSSGLVWAECVVPHNGVSHKIKFVKVIDITSSEIKLSWNQGCSDWNGIRRGFKISYCLVDNEIHKCIDNNSYFLDNGYLSDYKLTNLKPNSKYILTLSAVTQAGAGELHEPCIITTKEKALPLWLIIICAISSGIFFVLLTLTGCFVAIRIKKKIDNFKNMNIILPTRLYNDTGLTDMYGDEKHKTKLYSTDNISRREANPKFSTENKLSITIENSKSNYTSRNFSGNSSRCVSGHESISSSSTIRTRISDSGTELEPSSPDYVFKMDSIIENALKNNEMEEMKSKGEEEVDNTEINVNYSQITSAPPRKPPPPYLQMSSIAGFGDSNNDSRTLPIIQNFVSEYIPPDRIQSPSSIEAYVYVKHDNW